MQSSNQEQTISKSGMATSVSTLDHSGSSKNDNCKNQPESPFESIDNRGTKAMITSTFNGTTLKVTSVQLEQIKQQFSWCYHPLNSNEIIIDVQDHESALITKIAPDTELITGIMICYC